MTGQQADPYPVSVVEEYVDGELHLGTGVPGFFDLLTEHATRLEVPPFKLTAVLSGDIARSVQERGESGFSVERWGGQVAGKTLPRREDFSHADVIVDAALFDTDSQLAIVQALEVLIHEYGHAMLGRMRAVAGTKPPVAKGRMQAIHEISQHLAYEATDEYRCERFAHGVLRPRITATVDGAEVPQSQLWQPNGRLLAEEFRELLDDLVHPGWPSLVQSYRVGETVLEDLYWDLGTQVVAVYKHLARAEAAAGSTGLPSVLTEHAEHPGVELYLRDAWTPLVDLVQPNEPIPSFTRFGAADVAMQAAGSALVDMFAMLGVRSEITRDGNLYIHVSAPVR